MQVSWIDADSLKALVEQIAPQEERVVISPPVVEIETAPEEAFSWQSEVGFAQVNAADEGAEKAVVNAVESFHFPEPRSEPHSVPVIEEEAHASDAEHEDEHDSHGHALRNPAAALPLSRIRDKLRAIRQRATEAGILTRPAEPSKAEAPVEAAGAVLNEESDDDVAMREVSSPVADLSSASVTGLPNVPSFEIPRGPQNERLAAFAGWARQVLREDGGHVLVMSDDGEVLWGGEAKAGLVLSTMMAWGAAIRAGAAAACSPPPMMHRPLASGHVLTVIPCETSAGVVHAAVAAPEGLGEDAALLLRGALCAAMSAEAAPFTS